MNQDKLVTIENGVEKSYDVYFSFVCKEVNKGYIGYTDHQLDENGKELIYINAYDPNIGPSELQEVTDPQEMELVDNVMEKIGELAKLS